jgi:hypothetical protein
MIKINKNKQKLEMTETNNKIRYITYRKIQRETDVSPRLW